MKFIEKLLLESEDKETRRKLKLAGYLYREIENDENSEQLEELVSLIVEALSKSSPVTNAASRQFESEVIDAFYRYLLNSGKTKLTSYDYCTRIVRILKEHCVPAEDLLSEAIRIQELIYLYSKGGAKYEENVKQHNGPLSALKQFMKFIDGIKK